MREGNKDLFQFASFRILNFLLFFQSSKEETLDHRQKVINPDVPMGDDLPDLESDEDLNAGKESEDYEENNTEPNQEVYAPNPTTAVVANGAEGTGPVKKRKLARDLNASKESEDDDENNIGPNQKVDAPNPTAVVGAAKGQGPAKKRKSTSELARDVYTLYLDGAERVRNIEAKMLQCMEKFLTCNL